MGATTYRNRSAFAVENEHLEIIVTREGGHIAAIRDKATGVNPLWSTPWQTMEPSAYNREKHPEYGDNAESKLLSGILGHNLCLDLFGGPSAEEAAAGMTVHGEGSVVAYDVLVSGDTLHQAATLPQPAGKRRAEITETVENLSTWDRPVAWTQHVTLGPPFLEKGKTEFRASATKSKVVETDFTGGKGYMKTGAEFNWPMVPCEDGSQVDLRVFIDKPVSGAFSTHLMDPSSEEAYFSAWSPTSKLMIAYVWKRSDFPWLGIWEENYSRTTPPWNGRTLTRGMEFGASPFAESRRQMIDRGGLFGVPGYRWIPARSKVTVRYAAILKPASSADEPAD
ncbi:MAG: hypothetical protein HZB13_03170 [Acidobacteria bacterium]|nr:hypothetical protein [Acidobacteriota bacterium]